MSHDEFGLTPWVEARMMANLDRPGVYVPEIISATTPSELGEEGEAVGLWSRKGHWIRGNARFLFAADMVAGTGQARISLPWPIDYSIVMGSGTIAAGSCLGTGRIRQQGSAGANSQILYLQAPDPAVQRDVVFMVPVTGNASVTPTAPFAWEVDTRIAISFHYPADPDQLPR